MIKLTDVQDQLEYILNHKYENYENPAKVREADMEYLFGREEAYKSGKPIQWGGHGVTWGRIENGEYKD